MDDQPRTPPRTPPFSSMLSPSQLFSPVSVPGSVKRGESEHDPFKGHVNATGKSMINKLKAMDVISDDRDASGNMLRFHAWMMGLIQNYSHNIITTSLNQLKGIIQGSVTDEEVVSSYPDEYKNVYNEGKAFLVSISDSFKSYNSYPPSVTAVTDTSNILIIEGIFGKIPEAEVDTDTPPPILETKVFTALRSILNYSKIRLCVKNENYPSLDYLMDPFENYTKVFGAMFCNLLSSQDVHHSAKTWRQLIEHISAVSQCNYAKRLIAPDKDSQLYTDWNKCYICGEGSEHTAYECEHVLYAFLAIGLGVGSGIIQSSDVTREVSDVGYQWYLTEYANAHRCCNQIKSDDNWVTIKYDNSQNQYVISPSDELIKKTLINIKEGIKRKLYDCESITQFTEKGIQDRVNSIIEPRLRLLCNLATEEASRYKSHFIISMRLKQLIALRRTIKTMSESFLRSGQTHPSEEPEAKRQKVELAEKETRIKNADKLLTDAPSITSRLRPLQDMSGVSLRDTTSYITKKTNELIDFKCKNAFITSFTNDKNVTYNNANNYLVQITTDSTEKENFKNLLKRITRKEGEQLPAVFTPSSISELFKTVIREDVLERSIGFIDRLIDIYNPPPPPQDESSPSSPDTVMIHPSIAKTIIEMVVLQVGYTAFTNFIECRLPDTEISGNPYLSVVVSQFNKSNIVKNTQHYIHNLKGNFSRFIESARQNKELSDNELDKLDQFITYDVNECKSPSSSSGLTGGGGDDDQQTLFYEIGERTGLDTLNRDYMVLYLETVYGNRGHVLQTTFDELYQDLLEDKDDGDGFITDNMHDVIINDIKDGIKQISDDIHAKYQQVVEEFITNIPSDSQPVDSQPVYGEEETQERFESDDEQGSPPTKKTPFDGGSSITRKRRVKHKRIHKSRNKRRVTKHRETIRRSKRRDIHKYSKNKRNRRQRQHV